MSEFDTTLTAPEESKFQTWKTQYAPHDSGEDYDLRGAFKAGLKPDPKTGHWPDTFKKPNHPTFSVESQYAKYAPQKAGRWEGDKFIPPPQQSFKTWGQIAGSLPPMLDQDTYDSIRKNYFAQVVTPGLKSKGMDPGKYLDQFMSRTERKPITGPMDKTLSLINVAGMQAAISSLTTIKNLPEVGPKLASHLLSMSHSPAEVGNDPDKALAYMTDLRDAMKTLFKRDTPGGHLSEDQIAAGGGMALTDMLHGSHTPEKNTRVDPTKAAEFGGDAFTQVAQWEATAAPALKLAQRFDTVRPLVGMLRDMAVSGTVQGMFNTLTSEAGQRWHNGLIGFGFGGALGFAEGVLSLPTRLAKAGVVVPEVAHTATENLQQAVALGQPIHPAAQPVIAREIGQSLEAARTEARPQFLASDSKINGVVLDLEMPNGATQRRRIVFGNEQYEARNLLKLTTQMNVTVKGIRYNPRDLAGAQRFQDLIRTHIEQKYTPPVVLRVEDGHAQAVADHLTAAGSPAEVQGKNVVVKAIVAPTPEPLRAVSSSVPKITSESTPDEIKDALWPFKTQRSTIQDVVTKLNVMPAAEGKLGTAVGSQVQRLMHVLTDPGSQAGGVLGGITEQIRKIPDFDGQIFWDGEMRPVHFGQADRQLLMNFASEVREAGRPSGSRMRPYSQQGLTRYVNEAFENLGSSVYKTKEPITHDDLVHLYGSQSKAEEVENFLNSAKVVPDSDAAQRFKGLGLTKAENTKLTQIMGQMGGYEPWAPGRAFTTSEVIQELTENYPRSIPVVLDMPGLSDGFKFELRQAAAKKGAQVQRFLHPSRPPMSSITPKPSEMAEYSVKGDKFNAKLADGSTQSFSGPEAGQRAVNANGAVKFKLLPHGETPWELQVAQAHLNNRRIGSIEDVPTSKVKKVIEALGAKGFVAQPLEGWKPSTFEVVYHKPGEEVTSAVALYRKDIMSQRFPSPDHPELTPTEHTQLGKEFGIKDQEVSQWLSDKAHFGRSNGQVPIAEVRNRPGLGMATMETGQRGMNHFYGRDNVAGQQTTTEELPIPGLPPDYPLLIENVDLKTPGTQFHETLHLNIDRAEQASGKSFISGLSNESVKSLIEIADDKNALSQYQQLGRSRKTLVEEAITWVGESIHTDRREILDMFAKADGGSEGVYNLAEDIGNNLRASATKMQDSVQARLMQRQGWQLATKAAKGRIDGLRSAAERNGHELGHILFTNSGIKTIFTDGSTHIWEDMESLFNTYLKSDPYFTSPNMTGKFEAMTKAKINGIVPEGMEPRGGDPKNLPMPDAYMPEQMHGMEWAKAAYYWRPFDNWLSHYHTKLNTQLAESGKYVPLFETIHPLQEKTSEFQTVAHNIQKEYYNHFKDFPGKRLNDVFMYLAEPQGDRQWVIDQLHFTPAEVAKLDKAEQWLAGPVKETLKVDMLNYMQNTWKTLAGFNFQHEHVWGNPSRNATLGPWEDMVTSGYLDPQDIHFGRFFNRVMQGTLQESIMGPELRSYENLLKTKGEDGRPIVGPLYKPLKADLDYRKRLPDGTQVFLDNIMGDVVKWSNSKIAEINKAMPEGFKLSQVDIGPRDLINKYMTAQYVAGLGLRAGVLMRDASQSFITNFPTLGPTHFFAGMRDMFDPALKDLPEKWGVLIRQGNVGDLYGDLVSETTPSNFTRIAQMALAPISASHNIDRRLAFLGQRARALPAITDFVSGKSDMHDFMIKSGLWFHDENISAGFIREVNKPLMSDEVVIARGRLATLESNASANPNNTKFADEVTRSRTMLAKVEAQAQKELPAKIDDLAGRIAREYVYLSQWPYLRGTQPGLLKTGLGRIAGQFGVWPAHYTEFVRRMASKALQPEYRMHALYTMALWTGANYAITKGYEAIGADAGKWFWLSGMGYMETSPTFQVATQFGKVFKDSQEGRDERKKLFEFPLNFIAGSVEMRRVISMMSKGHLNLPELLGFTPYHELQSDPDIKEWMEQQFGEKPMPRRKTE